MKRTPSDGPPIESPAVSVSGPGSGPGIAPGVASGAGAGTWASRPAGIPASVPPPSVPLSFFAAAGLGLVACGLALFWSRQAAVVDPTDDSVVAAAHFAMLATLSMGVLGAIHQFVPVITQRPLRSVRISRATFATWLLGAWMLPIGFASRHEPLVEVGGAFAALAVGLLVANVAPALAARGKGVPVTGLRLAVGGFVVTAGYGVIYAADRRGAWFDLSGHVVLAHAVVGLVGWLGLTYVSVAEKLWPMFLLAHVPGARRSPSLAVGGIAAGVLLLSPGLLFGVAALAVAGAALIVGGLGAHLVSLSLYVRHRRRAADLHLIFVVTAALYVLVGVALALAAALAISADHHRGVALVAASVAAVAGWLLVALVGHAHKVVPFILWSYLRGRGIRNGADGRQLMFADLYSRGASVAAYGLVTLGAAAVVTGLAVSNAVLLGAGGILLAASAPVVAFNLSWRTLRLVARERAVAAPTEPVVEGAAGR